MLRPAGDGVPISSPITPWGSRGRPTARDIPEEGDDLALHVIAAGRITQEPRGCGNAARANSRIGADHPSSCTFRLRTDPDAAEGAGRPDRRPADGGVRGELVVNHASEGKAPLLDRSTTIARATARTSSRRSLARPACLVVHATFGAPGAARCVGRSSAPKQPTSSPWWDGFRTPALARPSKRIAWRRSSPRGALVHPAFIAGCRPMANCPVGCSPGHKV